MTSPHSAIARDQWSFDDFIRRHTQTLFTEMDDAPLNSRRLGYRLALLHIIEGLATESPRVFDVGRYIVESEFRALLRLADARRADDPSQRQRTSVLGEEDGPYLTPGAGEIK